MDEILVLCSLYFFLKYIHYSFKMKFDLTKNVICSKEDLSFASLKLTYINIYKQKKKSIFCMYLILLRFVNPNYRMIN